MPADHHRPIRTDRSGVLPAGRVESWGRYPRVARQDVVPVDWRSDPPHLDGLDRPVLPFGLGRSYGDVCLNGGNILLDTSGLRRFLAFDTETGVLACEAGVTLAEILDLTVPRGWIPAVLPGTQFVTVGGAIANDVHGKNHHRSGSFGCHVRRLELLRSTGERLACSPDSHRELFAATIGGLGLTGLILSAELTLQRVGSPDVSVEHVRLERLADFFDLTQASDATHEYTVAWIDCLAPGHRLGRGVLFRANHVGGRDGRSARRRHSWRMPLDAPAALLHRRAVRLFNAAYYARHRGSRRPRPVPYRRFFFPLDRIRNWNRLYGKRGFLQYQCVVPPETAAGAVAELLERVRRAGAASLLAVLKRFGSRRSLGMLSFPRPGVTLAMDFPLVGEATLRLCSELDRVVAEAGGALYPAKDARMAPELFERSFPQAARFRRSVDPGFSSSFWRRVNGRPDPPPR